MFSPSAEQLTGKVGLGSIVLLAGYLVVDSQRVGLYSMVETYGGTVSWAIVISVPTVVVSYVLGVLSIDAAQVILGVLPTFRGLNEGEDLVLLGKAPDLLQGAYLETIRRMELLQGASVAFLLLSCGCIADGRALGAGGLAWILVVVAVAFAAFSLIFAGRSAKKARRLVRTLNTVSAG